MDADLKRAAEDGNIELLYDSIRKNAKVLDDINEIPFADTPLHAAASAGQTRFAMEIAMLKPSFATKLNQDGFTPMHLALQYDHTDLVLRLIDVHKDLVRVQGKGGATPLHCVAQLGNLRLLHEFLQVCPKSLEVVTTQRETALHIALKHDRCDAFEYLVGWLRRAWFRNAYWWERKYLNWKDDEGNTVLHLAVSRNLPQVVKSLVSYASVDKNIKNSEGHTALDLSDNQEIKDLLCRAKALRASSLSHDVSITDDFRSPPSVLERLKISNLRQKTNIKNDVRNMLLVVATLILAVAYEAAVSPPGGVWQENSVPGILQFNRTTTINATNDHEVMSQPPHHAGTVILSNKQSYHFLISNSLMFYTTGTIMYFLLPVDFSLSFIIPPLLLLVFCYYAALLTVFPTAQFLHSLLLVFYLCISLTLQNNVLLDKRQRGYIQTFLPMIELESLN